MIIIKQIYYTYYLITEIDFPANIEMPIRDSQFTLKQRKQKCMSPPFARSVSSLHGVEKLNRCELLGDSDRLTNNQFRIQTPFHPNGFSN